MALAGGTGVGKSSLLDAGLLPRLTHTHEVRYAPRDRTLGLLGTLAKALGVEAVGAGEAAAVADGWRALETQCGRPLFVVIDQVEEAFTGEDAGRAAPGAGTRELDAFASAIGRLFANPADRPRGRLVLGFRKEWLSEVKAALETHRVARAEHRLEQLTRGGVLEAITGPTRIPARRMPVRLEVEPGLDILIADDLLAKRASHVAPLLQILLATMWAEAPRRGDVVRFDAALYEAVQAKSKQLDQFLDEQLHALREWNPAVVDSGLALDFLRFYTTPKGTSDEHTVDEEAQRYPNANETSPGMRAMCARLFLLVERADESSTPLPGRPARLAHDTLAPIVRERFDRSDLPGPRAKRVLDGRSAEWKDGKTGIPLDEQDLAVVEAGQHGMRAWNDDEKALVAASQAARARARRRRAWVIRGAIAAVAIIVAFGVGSWLLYRQSQDRLAESTSRELSGRSLATNAMRRDVSLLYAAAAYDQAPTFEARRALLAQLGRDPALVRVSSLFTSDMVLTADGDRVVAADVGGIKLIDLETGVVTAAPRPSAGVYDTSTFTIDPSGTAYGSVAVDTATSIATIGVWEVESGKQLGTFRVPSPDEGLAWTMGPPMADGRRLVAVGEGNETVLWDLGSATRVRRLRHAAAPERAYFSNDGSILVTTSDIGRVIVWDVATGATIKTVRIHPDRMPRVAISSDNSAMALVADDTVTMWWLRMSRAPRVLTARNYGLVAFTSGDSALVINASGGEYHVFDRPLDTLSVLVGGAPSRTLHGVGDLPGVLVASLRGNRVASSYADIIHVWDLTARRDSGNLVRVSALPLEEAAEVVFLSPDGKVAAAQGLAITIWDVEARRQVGDAIPVSTRADQPRLPVLPIVAGGSGRFIAAPGLLLGAQRTETFFDVRQPAASPKLAATDNAPPSFEPLGTRVAYGLTGSRRVVIEDLGNPGAPDTLDPGPNPGMPVDSTWGAPTAFNQRGDVLVAQVALGHVLVWDLSTRRVRDSIAVDGGMATQLYVSDDGSRVAMVFSFDKAVAFWGRGWPNPVRTLRLPTVSGWYSSALSADGRSFAVSSYEAVVLADVERGEVVGELVVPSGGSLVAFADGGRELVAVSGDGRVHRVSTDPAAWADRACRVAASPDSFRRFREDAPAGVQPPKRCASPPAR